MTSIHVCVRVCLCTHGYVHMALAMATLALAITPGHESVVLNLSPLKTYEIHHENTERSSMIVLLIGFQ